MPLANPEPFLISHVYTKNNSEYLLIEYRSYGYELQRTYAVHLCDIKKGLFNKKPVQQIYLPHSERNRYRNYYKNFLGILSYAISTEKFIPGQTYKAERLFMGFKEVDRWFRLMKRDIKKGLFDSQNHCGPEI